MKKVLLIILLILAALEIFLIVFLWSDKPVDYDVSADNATMSVFTVGIQDFEQQLDDTQSLPFTASAIIDINNNGTEDIFIGGLIGGLFLSYSFITGKSPCPSLLLFPIC